ncbi:MAG: helix-turn-helix domain-containing protein [Bradymonadaceae bacterium]
MSIITRSETMANRLGEVIREARDEQGVGVRELARRIDRSASFIVRLEKDDAEPSVAEETLERIAEVLQLDADRLITLAGKTPSDVQPEDEEEVALFRSVKELDEEGREAVREYLEQLSD